jgi:predicted ArsR family transcriptional regulator
MKSTRVRLLDHLGEKQVATATELSRALQVTSADVRHHLTALRKEGFIEVIGERQPQGPGRPARLFSLSHKQRSDNIILLIEALFQEITMEKSTTEQSRIWRSIAEKLMGASHSRGNLTQRLYIAIKRLNELNYHARWEAHPEAPKIILGNCPYSAIIDNHPKICLIDKSLIEGLLATTVTQEAKLTRDDRGYSSCLFSIGR